MSYEMIAVLMFSSMMLMLLTGQRVFGAIGFVAVVAALCLWGDGGSEMAFTSAMKLMKWYPLLTLPSPHTSKTHNATHTTNITQRYRNAVEGGSPSFAAHTAITTLPTKLARKPHTPMKASTEMMKLPSTYAPVLMNSSRTIAMLLIPTLPSRKRNQIIGR